MFVKSCLYRTLLRVNALTLRHCGYGFASFNVGFDGAVNCLQNSVMTTLFRVTIWLINYPLIFLIKRLSFYTALLFLPFMLIFI